MKDQGGQAREKEFFPARRAVLKGGAALAGAALLNSATAGAGEPGAGTGKIIRQVGPDRTDKDVQVVHSVCLGCNAGCGNRSVVKNGRLESYSGNPYHPYNHLGNPVDYDTPVAEALSLSSPVCAKAHDAPNYVYNPYRILKPLKRMGPRGTGRFEPVEWEQMIKEITEGGRLFAHLGEKREVAGLKALDSDEPIDPAAPELGPKRNGFVFMTGRLQAGRKQIIDRFVKNAMGSKNRIGHTDICGLGFRMGNFALTDKEQCELKADPWGAEYILVFGANIYEALQPGVNTYGAAVAGRSSEGKVKFVIVDPRAQHASVHAEDWIAVKPGQDGALAMGLIRWMMENNRYNKNYLVLPNPDAALQKGYVCYSNATHLVIDDAAHPHNRKFLRISDLDPAVTGDSGQAWVVLSPVDRSPIAFDQTGKALIDGSVTVRGAGGARIKVKTAFCLMKEGVMARSIEQYAELAGVPRAQIEKTAEDFSAHGTRAAVCQYHGAGNYVSGTYAAYAVAMLNVMVGSIEAKGGFMSAGGAAASWKNGLYDLQNFSGRRKPAGVAISREKAVYENSTEYRQKEKETGCGYPARRPWFAFTKGGLSVETLSGVDRKYPYRCGVLFHYFYNPVYSTPGGYRYKETLKDHDKVPLYVSIDTNINESNIFADYIIPDITYAEGHYGWLSPHAPALRFTGIRTPSILPLTGKTADNRCFCLETFLIDLAEKMDLPGFGADAIPGRDGRLHPLHRAEDFYLRGFANIARQAEVPSAVPAECSFVEKNYPVARFKDILPPREWRMTCHVLARGGVFGKYEDVFVDGRFKYGVKRVLLYSEDLAGAKNSLTGEFFPGTLTYIPPRDSAGNIITEKDRDYPFTVITHKMNVHTQSRTGSHLWAMEIFPENFIMMNVADACLYGLQDGDRLRLISRSNRKGITGKVRLTKLIRRGCISVSNHYGHTQHGASTLTVKNGDEVFMGGRQVMDRDELVADPKRATGLNTNMVSRLDENLADTPLVDLTGGMPDFSSTRVKVVKEL